MYARVPVRFIPFSTYSRVCVPLYPPARVPACTYARVPRVPVCPRAHARLRVSNVRVATFCYDALQDRRVRPVMQL